MIINSKQIIAQAHKNGFAVPQFNTSTLEATKAIFEVASKLKKMVILATSEGEVGYLGPEVIVGIVKALSAKFKIDIVLHLDHCHDLDIAKKCLEAGYKSIHFDGSFLPYEANIQMTQKARKLADQFGASLEGELGSVPTPQFKGQKVELELTDLELCVDFVKKTKIDALAVSVGTIHGAYKGKPKIDFRLLAEINKKVRFPLVLHGASMVPDADIKKAIKLGIAKINFNTELRMAYVDTLTRVLARKKKEYTPYKILPEVIEEVEKVVEKKIKLVSG